MKLIKKLAKAAVIQRLGWGWGSSSEADKWVLVAGSLSPSPQALHRLLSVLTTWQPAPPEGASKGESQSQKPWTQPSSAARGRGEGEGVEI